MTLIDTVAEPSLPQATETGALGVFQLKRMWSRIIAMRRGCVLRTTRLERQLDRLVIHACGLGLEQTTSHFGGRAESFEEFERWVLATTGGVAPERVARINATIEGRAAPPETAHWLASVEASTSVLSAADLEFWEQHGYVVLHDAVTPAIRDAAAQALWQHLGAREDDPETWYRSRDHGIMVQYFQHPAFEAIRRSLRIHKRSRSCGGPPIYGRRPIASASTRPSAKALGSPARICTGM